MNTQTDTALHTGPRPCLALFIDFSHQPCLVVGGGAVAARKLARLLAAGASITLVAPRLGPETRACCADGRIVYHQRPYQPGDLEGQKLIVAATDDEGLNQEIAQAARARDIPVNVASPAGLSTVLLPGTIERGPVRIAVSSGGASPALMRQLRRHLEALIPRAYGDLASVLATCREKIKQRFPDREMRRRFHREIVEGEVCELAFAGERDRARAVLEKAIENAQFPVSRGEVYLVGAGPGDPQLLTLRALRLMQKAEVVVYDRLVGPEILALLRPDIERHYVGKARDRHTRPQHEINQLLLEQAQAGKRVLRLKGGDPFIFGRGGEEMETLITAGIPFQVVPGVTAATGCAAYAGIPLTHREMAHSCIFLTGHFSSGETHVDWRALAQPGQTLVFYMGVYNLGKISERLLAHGMSAAMPVAIIQNGTLPEQEVQTMTLGELASSGIDHAIPGLVIVSETVSLSAHYRKILHARIDR